MRLVSRFAMTRSEEDRLERLASEAELAGVDENDPKTMARFMKKMGQELGEDAGPEFEQAMEELERGETGDGEEGAETSADSALGSRLGPEASVTDPLAAGQT